MSPSPRPGGQLTYLSTLAFDEAWLDGLRSAFPGLRVLQLTAASAQEVPAQVWEQVDVLHTHSALPDPALAPRLRWVQLDTSGVDHLRGTPAWTAPFAVTSLGGVAPTALAEYVMLMVLGHAHRMGAMRDVARTRAWPDAATRWARFLPAPLAGATVGVVGYGRIGRAVGRLAAAHGMRVLGVTRSGTAPPAVPHATSTGASAPVEVVGPEHLHDVLARADYVVVLLPLTPETAGVLDAAAIAAMKPGAVVVNVARGGVVDEGALLGALRTGHLAGASLDVFEQEPLPPDSPWWQEPDVFVTPHVAGLTGDYAAVVQRLVAENLRRFLDGRDLVNVVDRDAGY